MFRDCCFNYAGKYSGDYDLRLMYVDDSSSEFDTGGDFEISSDTLPRSAETLLYDKKYGEKPLEFSVEIVCDSLSIPIEKMREIKKWLFGQSTWQPLYLYDEDFKNYHLVCLLVPDKDITGAYGYRGFKCTIKNISPFWYGEKVFKTWNEHTSYEWIDNPSYPETSTKPKLIQLSEFNIDTDNPYRVDCNVMFTITSDNNYNFFLGNSHYEGNTINTEHTTTHIKIIDNATSATSGSFVYDSSFATIKHTDGTICENQSVGLDDMQLLSFYSGLNRMYISADRILGISSVSIEYTPMYRLGGF